MKLTNILRRRKVSTEEVKETTLPTENSIIKQSRGYQQEEGMDPFVAIVLSSVSCLALNLEGTPIGIKAKKIINLHKTRLSNSMKGTGLWEIVRDVEDLEIMNQAKELIVVDCAKAAVTNQYSQEHQRIILMIIHVTADYMRVWNCRN